LSDDKESDKESDDEEDEGIRRSTRRGVVVTKTVTEQKTRRRTVHEHPVSGGLSPSRRSGVPIPAGPILNRYNDEDNDDEKSLPTKRQSPGRRSLGVKTPVPAGPIKNRDDSDDDDEEDDVSTKRLPPGRKSLLSFGRPVPAGPIVNSKVNSEPKRQTLVTEPKPEKSVFSSVFTRDTKSSQQASSSNQNTSGPSLMSRLFYGGKNYDESRAEPRTRSDLKENSNSKSSRTRGRMDFSDSDDMSDEGDYTFREVANAGVNTSGAWSENTDLGIGSSYRMNQSGLSDSQSWAGTKSSLGLDSSYTTSRRPINSSPMYSQPYSTDNVASRFGQPPTKFSSSHWDTQEKRGLSGASFGRSLSGRRSSFMSGKGQIVSRLLFVLPVILLVMFAMFYVNLKFNSSTIDTETSSNFMLCSDLKDEKDCLKTEEVQNVKTVLRKLAELLAKQAGDHDCEYSSVERHMDVDDIKRLLRRQNLELPSDPKLLNVISKNPTWQIKMLDSDGKETTNVATVKSLESQLAVKGLLCRVRLALNRLAYSLSLFICGVGLVVVVLLLVRYWMKYKQARTKQIHHLVEDVISMLKNHSTSYKEGKSSDMLPYIPVPHVRDSLIPLKDRRSKQWMWNKVVEFLSANESRIRTEVHLIDGEETDCWKWIETYSDPLLTSGREESRVNARPMSSCLKISNLLSSVDESDGKDRLTSVRDAVLDKCGTYHGILHMATDRSMKDECVYVKCVSDKAAQQNHKILHGWLYKGKVVSVQYIGEIMYRTLFPDSVDAMVPLKSSSKRQPIVSGYH